MHLLGMKRLLHPYYQDSGYGPATGDFVFGHYIENGCISHPNHLYTRIVHEETNTPMLPELALDGNRCRPSGPLKIVSDAWSSYIQKCHTVNVSLNWNGLHWKIRYRQKRRNIVPFSRKDKCLETDHFQAEKHFRFCNMRDHAFVSVEIT